MQNPPPPPPPSGPPPMMPPPPPGGGMPPMMPAGGGGYAMATPGNLATPGLRIVGGLIDVVIIFVFFAIVDAIFKGSSAFAGLVNLIVVLGYFGYLWSSRGASVGMMPFGFKVRDVATGRYPTVSKAALRGVIWTLEFGFTIFIVGAVAWLWQLWDPQRQAIHDKIAGTIVTTS